MVQVIRNDLEFILQQIKIAEADARGEQIVGTLIPSTELPWGLRHVDGSNNNLTPGRESFGAANQQFPRALETRWVNEGDDGMVFGPPRIDPATSLPYQFPGVPAGYIPLNNGLGPNGTNLPATYLNNNDYSVQIANNPAIAARGIQPGDVVDADPRIISNLIADQTLNNYAAVASAFAGAGSADPYGDAGAVRTLFLQYKAAQSGVNVGDANVQAAQAIADQALADFNAAQTAYQAAQARLDAAQVAVASVQPPVTLDQLTAAVATARSAADTAAANASDAAIVLATAKTALDAAQTILDGLKGARDAAAVDSNVAAALVVSLQAALADAEAARDALNFDPDALNAAQLALAAAQAALQAATTSETDAAAAVAAAEAAVAAAMNNESAYAAAQAAVDAALANLTAAQAAAEAAAQKVVAAEAAVSAQDSAVTAALATLEEAVLARQAAIDAAAEAVTAQNNFVDALEALAAAKIELAGLEAARDIAFANNEEAVAAKELAALALSQAQAALDALPSGPDPVAYAAALAARDAALAEKNAATDNAAAKASALVTAEAAVVAQQAVVDAAIALYDQRVAEKAAADAAAADCQVLCEVAAQALAAAAAALALIESNPFLNQLVGDIARAAYAEKQALYASALADDIAANEAAAAAAQALVAAEEALVTASLELEALQTARDAAGQQNVAAQARLDAAIVALASAEEALSQIGPGSGDYAAALAAVNAAQAAFAAADAAAKEAADALAEAEAALAPHQGTIGNLQAQADAAKIALNTANAQALEAAFAAGAFSGAEAALAAAQAELETLKAARDAAIAESDLATGAIPALQTALAEAQAALGEIGPDQQALAEAIAALEVAQGVLAAATITKEEKAAAVAAATQALADATANAGDYSDAQAAVVDAAAKLLAAQTTALDKKTALDSAQAAVDAQQAIVSEKRSEYDAALTAKTEADAIASATTAALISALQALIEGLTTNGGELAAQTELAAAYAEWISSRDGFTTAEAALTTANAELDAAKAAAGAYSPGELEAQILAKLEAAGIPVEASPTGDLSKLTLVIQNVAPDEGLSAPFNSWFTIFGQFFDHGLDLLAKGGFGTVYIPLQPDDPLYNPATPNTNFMVVTRTTLNANGEATNKVTPFVDQNQTYTSHPSHQVFLREYALVDGKPVSTGRLLNGNEESGGGLATWADVKAQARDLLGIELNDMDVHHVPLLATDPYGNFIPGANGLPQIVMLVNGQQVLVEGNLASPVSTIGAVHAGVTFLDDIAHNATPAAGKIADADSLVSTADQRQPAGTYDDELLDRHYITGDGRGNENIALSAVHHVFHAEHNRQYELMRDTLLADAKEIFSATGDFAAATEFLNEWLATPVLNQQQLLSAGVNDLEWNGSRLFQSAKFVTEMQYQHLVFEEFARKVQPFLNVFLDFKDTIDPAILAEFAHVVYRFGHSMLNEGVDRYDANYNADHIDLITAFLNPVEYATSGLNAEEAAGAIARGMTRQAGNEIDEFVTEALRNNLVGLPLDLAAINIARGRETGVPTLNDARAQFFAGSGDSQIKPYESWYDFSLNIKNPVSIINFVAAYGTHETIVNATTVEAKRDAAMALVMGGDGAPADRLDFLLAQGAYAGGDLGGLNTVDFWIGGLAEKKMVFGGMLGSTFNFVFENQLEALQDGDRFYYLTRLANLNLTAQMENNKFSEMIHRNTTATHLPGDVFARPDFFIEADQSKQFNAGLGSADPTEGGDAILSTILPKVIRTDVNNDGISESVRFTGAEHVVLGGTAGDDTLIGGKGDDTLWGDAGNDRLEGGEGNDFIFGGDGDDIITDEFGDDEIRSGAGDDVVTAGQGINLIITDTGSDFVVGGQNLDDILAGQGNDFVRGSLGGSLIMGGEGNDWLESAGSSLMLGDNGDLVQGLPIKRSVTSTVVGHDVLIGGPGNDDFDAETGDDIMVAGLGTNKFFGQFGFDWGSHANASNGVLADMANVVFAEPASPASQAALLHRYTQTEALSGSRYSDVLRGDDLATFGADHALMDANVSLINGLAEFLGGVDEAGDVRFSSGNIILGGGGSDIIMGRGGNDLIDGNRFLDVKIKVTPENGDAPYFVSSMTEIQAKMFSGELKPRELSIWREIKDGSAAGDVDVVQMSGNLADYTIEGYNERLGIATDVNADGFISITDNRAGGGGQGGQGGRGQDGTDLVANIERVLFANGSVKISVHDNRIAEGRVRLEDGNGQQIADGQAVGVAGQVLRASMLGVTDRDNRSADNATGTITSPVVYTWQVETVAGSGVFTDILQNVVDAFTIVNGETYTVSAAQAGLAIRVVARFVDAKGAVETVYSNANEGGNPIENFAATGAPGISDTTPVLNQLLFATVLGSIADENGLPLLGYNYQWQVLVNDQWVDIAGATGQTFRPQAAQVGSPIRVEVSFTDNDGFVETLVSAATRPVGNVINGTTGADRLIGTDGEDQITGNRGNDTIDAGGGDDTIIWNASLLGTAPDGRDIVNGGTEDVVGDTFVVNGSAFAETYRVYTRDAFLAVAGNAAAPLNAATEIVITRNGTGNGNVIAELAEIEEIVINTGLGNDTVTAIGNFSPTNLSFNTITINGSEADDVVDISGLESAHRILFRTTGGNDTVVGTLRPQDVIEIPTGASPTDYVATDNGNGTVTMASETQTITFTGSIDALPTLAAPETGAPGPVDPAPVDPAPVDPVPVAEFTVRDATSLLGLVRGINVDGNDDAADSVGVRDLTGHGNNIDNPGYGSADEPFIRLTDARYGAFNEAIGNNNINPIFNGLDPRAISNTLGAQEAETAQSTQANIFFMSFGQYFDHGLSFIPKGGNGSIQIGGPGMGREPGTDNPADLTRASVTGYVDGVPQHTNITSPFVDQNQVYGSSKQVGQLLRESDGNGGVGAKVLMGEVDPSAPQFHLLPTLRVALDHHIEAGTIFSSADRGDMTLLEYYPTLKNAEGQYDAATVKELVANFMGEGWPLLLDTNPFINLLDHIVTGDGRANENVTLTSMHTIFARNHNFHVEKLSAVYEEQGIAISKEELFQAAKIVNEAEYQRVVFTEFAEKLLGGEGIRGDGQHGFDAYVPETDARISHEFAAVAYRVGHTMIGQTITVLDANGNPKQVSLFDAFLNPTSEANAFAFDPDGAGPAPTIMGAEAIGALASRGYVPQPGYEQLGVASILGGIVGQPSEEVDVNIVDAVRNDLVRISADLFAFNVARGWDLGMGTLNQIRMDLSKSTNSYIQEAVGYTGELTPYTSWEDFQARNGLSDAVIAQFREAYPDLVLAAGDIASFQAVNPDIGLTMNQDGSATVKGIDRVDFWVGGLAEAKFEGGMVGSTFWVVLHEQFDRLQEGDRFYYIQRLENLDLYANFVEGQSFADIVMRNTGLQGLDERIFEVSDEDGVRVTLPAAEAPVDPTPVDPTPVDPTPVDPTPVDPTPVDPTPVDPTPVDPTPVDPTPVDPTPVDPTPVDPTPVDPTPVDPTPVDPAPVDPTPVDPTPVDPTPVDPTPVDPAPVVPAPVGGRTAYRGTNEADMHMAQVNVASFMDGLGGNDILFGGDLADIIFGGDGADKLFSGEGNDQAFGGDGDDAIFGEGGDDVLTGDAGSDVVLGGAGNDRFVATIGDGNDLYFGEEGVDTLDMSAITANTVVDLGSTRFGNGSAVSDQTGYDVLSGIENVITGSGNDTIYANDAVNMINAGAGNDTIQFRSAASANGDTIFGFEAGDLICLRQMDANLGVGGLQGFTLVTGQSFSDAGQLLIRHEMRDGGEVSIIEGNIGGDLQADFQIEVFGVLVQETNLLL